MSNPTISLWGLLGLAFVRRPMVGPALCFGASPVEPHGFAGLAVLLIANRYHMAFATNTGGSNGKSKTGTTSSGISRSSLCGLSAKPAKSAHHGSMAAVQVRRPKPY